MTNHEYAIAALKAIHRALHDLLDDEDLDAEKLERASEGLLPNCADWAAYGIREGTRGPKPPGEVPWPRPEMPWKNYAGVT